MDHSLHWVCTFVETLSVSAFNFKLKKLNQAIELAGGMALLMETEGDDRILTEPGTVVMQYQETDVTPKTEKWVKQVQDLLERYQRGSKKEIRLGKMII